MEKKNFILSQRFYEVFDGLTDAQIGKAIRALALYHSEGVDSQIKDRAVGLLYRMMKSELISQREKYEEVCEKNRRNVLKRYTGENDRKRADTTATDKDKDNDKEIEKDNDKNVCVSYIPTLTQVEEFVKRENLNLDPQKFFCFYEAKGWTYQGGAKMKNWQAEARLWAIKNRERSEPKRSTFANFTERTESYGDDLFADLSSLSDSI